MTANKAGSPGKLVYVGNGHQVVGAPEIRTFKEGTILQAPLPSTSLVLGDRYVTLDLQEIFALSTKSKIA